MRTWVRVLAAVLLMSAALGLGAAEATAGTVPDGGMVTGTATYQDTPIFDGGIQAAYAFSLTLVGTVDGTTDSFSLSGLNFVLTGSTRFCPPNGCTLTGTVSGSFPLVGSQGYQASCTGSTASRTFAPVLATTPVGQVGDPTGMSAPMDVPLSCTDATGTVPVHLSMYLPWVPQDSATEPLAGQFSPN